MNLLKLTVVLVSLVGVWAQTNVLRPPCDSPEAEELALVARDYLNGQHTHGYKYALNRIEDIKIYTKPDGDNTYLVEVDLLETNCHVLDPTPLANCTVRSKIQTAVEGDCDVVLKRVGGALTVTAFKCKTEESTEDFCAGCPILLPLNDTRTLNFVHASLATFNNITENVTYSLLEIGRMTSQVVSRGAIHYAEYVIVEANCTGDVCVPLNDAMAVRRFCVAKGVVVHHSVDCKILSIQVPVVDANSTAAPAPPLVVDVHTGSVSPKHGLKHHKLTAIHDPQLSGLLSAESAESAEAVPVTWITHVQPFPSPTADSASVSDGSASAEVPVAVVKREAPATLTGPIPLVPVCPGRVRFF